MQRGADAQAQHPGEGLHLAVHVSGGGQTTRPPPDGRGPGRIPPAPPGPAGPGRGWPPPPPLGTPTAMTGIPRCSSSRAIRALPTPEPGTMPVSETWTVRHTRSCRRAARASTAMRQAGLSFFTTAPMSSPLSIPVVPVTPAGQRGDRAEGGDSPGAWSAPGGG